MKKTTALISTLMIGSLLAGASVTAFAYDESKPAKVTSYGMLGFTKDDGEKEVEKPGEKPGDKPGPKDPEGPEENNDGPLRIVYASNFDFRTQKIKSTAQTVYASLTPWYSEEAATDAESKQTPGIPTANFVQVEDMRPGTSADEKGPKGWTLSVSQATDFTRYVEGETEKPSKPGKDNAVQKDSLKGLKMSLLGSEVFAPNVKDGKAPTIVGGDTIVIPSPGTGSVPVLTAEADAGVGRSSVLFGAEKTADQKGDFQDTTELETAWGDKFSPKGNAGVKLDIPAGTNAAVGTYFADIEWSLTSAPSNG